MALVGPSKIQIKYNWVKNPNWPGQTRWLFTSITKELNKELPRTNPASGQGRT